MKRYTLPLSESCDLQDGLHAHLTALAKQPGPAFLSTLADVVDTEVNSQSVGCSWLSNVDNAKLFVQHCRDTAGFFYRLQSRASAQVALESPVLLGSVPHNERETFILNMLRKGTMHYKPWYRWALEAGTNEKAVANVVLTMLKESERPLLDNSFHYSFVKVFTVCYGGLGHVSDDEELPDASTHKIYVDRPNMWSILTDDQLIEAARICESHCPGILFESSWTGCIYWKLEAYMVGIQRDRIDRQYNRRRLDELLLEVCTSVRDLSNILSTIFVDLPVQAQRELIEKHDGVNYSVLVTTALRLDDRVMFDRYFDKVLNCNPTWAHHFTNKWCRERPGALSEHIIQRMEAWIDAIGFKQAPASLDGDDRPFVILDGVRYVAAEGPMVKEQTVVLFDTNGTVVSENPRVVETSFWPI